MHISVLALVVAVKALPIPFPMKEALLDQLLGHHDDLYRRAGSPDTGRPLYERTVAASRIGAFDRLRVEPDGDAVYTYYKNGVPAYELVVRDGRPCHCTCVDFRMKVCRKPDYICKHGDLWQTMKVGLEALIEASGEAARAYMIARQRLRIGEGGAEEVRSAQQTMREIEARIGCFLPEEQLAQDPEPRRLEVTTSAKGGGDRMAMAA